MANLRRMTILLLIAWLVMPMVPLVIWSFAHGWTYPNLLPKAWSLQPWAYALSGQSGVLGSLALTTGIALATTALALLLGLPAGRALGQYQFRGKGLVEIFILAPLIVPGIAVGMGLHWVLLNLHLANTVFGVILAHLVPTLPYMVLVMSAVFATYDPTAEDQARSLGASPLQVFWYITLPAILPGIVVGAMFTFLVSWGQYILTLTIGGGRVVTLPLLLFQFATSGRADITGSIGVIYILPGLIVVAVAARHLTGRNATLAGLGR